MRLARGSKARWAVLLGATALALAACGGGSDSDEPADSAAPAAEGSTAAAAASGEKVNLTMWFWGDADAPGANAWLDDAVKAYQAANPNVTIEVVEQATDTFIASFQAAAAAKSGPDIAAQWATGPVLTQVWGGAVTAISDLVPAEETAH